jgi:hypothetical protein
MGSDRIVVAPPCTTMIAEEDEILDIMKPPVAAIRPPDTWPDEQCSSQKSVCR